MMAEVAATTNHLGAVPNMSDSTMDSRMPKVKSIMSARPKKRTKRDGESRRRSNMVSICTSVKDSMRGACSTARMTTSRCVPCQQNSSPPKASAMRLAPARAVASPEAKASATSSASFPPHTNTRNVTLSTGSMPSGTSMYRMVVRYRSTSTCRRVRRLAPPVERST